MLESNGCHVSPRISLYVMPTEIMQKSLIVGEPFPELPMTVLTNFLSSIPGEQILPSINGKKSERQIVPDQSNLWREEHFVDQRVPRSDLQCEAKPQGHHLTEDTFRRPLFVARPLIMQ